MELKEARLIAEETLRVIATHPDAMIEALNTIEKVSDR